MKQIIKYLLFVAFLVSVPFVAAKFDLTTIFGSPASKSATKKQSFSGVTISKKPAHLLTGLTGQVALDYSSLNNLTAAAADDVIMVWQTPETTPLRTIDSGEGFNALSLRFVPATSLVVAGGVMLDATGSIRFFDAATGNKRLQIDEAEPVQFLDPHPGGKYLLVTCETYIKVIDVKDGNTVAILQKSNPTSRGYYYGNGQYVLQSDSLALFDLKKRSMAGALDTVIPLHFKKGMDGTTFTWVSAEGVSVITALEARKKFYPIGTSGITAFDIESRGLWGLFLLDTQKIAVIELATGKTIKTIELTSPASDVTISSDGASAYIHFLSGTIGVYDIGYRNKLKSVRLGMSKLLGTVKKKLEPVAKPEPQ